MKGAEPKITYLKDYQPPKYWIDKTDLHFDLDSHKTLVTSRLSLRHNRQSKEDSRQLELVGSNLELKSISYNGKQLTENSYQLKGDNLLVQVKDKCFELEIVTQIDPKKNSSLEGLYLSKGMYCTQCEAEGFRKITYYLDRPDVMSVFSCRINANSKYPVLLSNGNLIDSGRSENGGYWAQWQDPFPKPAYLFALVAGHLAVKEDQFTTQSGRQVDLKIYTEPSNLHKCDHVLPFLQKAMRWDEQAYGREYDLDLFMIVAVDHFNMGAMENKGLNIFNSACVLASPETTTDQIYQLIESIIAHEYFHNWSGNRVTCRDWFQLSLKEGFTVFRDSQFSADINSALGKRIEDVNLLRSAQFAEDAGPMAHPVRPPSYIEISNFYTLTVYEKGAEVVRMLHTLLGAEKFRQGSDLYFERHDGSAATCDDFVAAMEDVSQLNLSQFKRWYSQAGTPKVIASDHYDEKKQQYRLTLEQSTRATAECENKAPFVIPFEIGLIGDQGEAFIVDKEKQDQSILLILTKVKQEFVFSSIKSRPVPSLLRNFSAPVQVEYPYSSEQLSVLMSEDKDPFNRWEAGQRLLTIHILEIADQIGKSQPYQLDPQIISSFKKILNNASLDLTLRTKMLQLPSESYLAEQRDIIDVEALHQSRNFVRQQLANALKNEFEQGYLEYHNNQTYQYNTQAVARRAFKNQCLDYLASLREQSGLDRLIEQYQNANNMTDQGAALKLLANEAPSSILDPILEAFYHRWSQDTLVTDLWFSIQAGSALHADSQRIKKLQQHPAFDSTNPNRLRALIGTFCLRNPVRFHTCDGSGYNLLTDWVLELDGKNPQIASRLLQPLTHWAKYNTERAKQMKSALKRIVSTTPLSKDVYEVASKSLRN